MIPDLHRILRDPAARTVERRTIRLTSFAVADFLRSTQPIDHGIIQRLHALRTIPCTATRMICPSLIGLVHGRARSQHGVFVPAPLRTRGAAARLEREPGFMSELSSSAAKAVVW